MARPDDPDPRIHVTEARLRALAGHGRALRLRAPLPSRSVLNGRHGSRLRGRGLDFQELRGYLPGDDPRSIDWRVTARTGTPHVRVFSQELDRPVLILCDQRQEMFFGSTVYMKSVVAAEAAALLAQAAMAQGARLGGIVFADTQQSDHRPARRPAALRRFVAAIAAANGVLSADGPPPTHGRLAQVLDAAARLAPPSALVIVISDFDGLAEAQEAPVRRLATRGNLILMPVMDRLGTDALPTQGRLMASDGAAQIPVDLRRTATRDQIAEMLERRLALLSDWAARHRAVMVPLDTERAALDQLRLHLGAAP